MIWLHGIITNFPFRPATFQRNSSQTQLAWFKILMTRGRCIIYRRKLGIKDQERSRKWECMNDFTRVSRFIAHYTQSISVIWRFDINGTRDPRTFIRRKLWAARARDVCTGMINYALPRDPGGSAGSRWVLQGSPNVQFGIKPGEAFGNEKPIATK